MNIFKTITLQLFIAFAAYCVAISAPKTTIPEFDNSLKNLELNQNDAKLVNSCFIEYDYFSLNLEEGKYYPLKNLNDRVWGGFYVGAGSMDFGDDNNVRAKVRGTQTKFSDDVEWAFFFSADTSLVNLFDKFPKTTSDNPDYKTAVNYFFSYNNDYEQLNPEFDLTRTVLDNSHNEYKYIIIKTKKESYPFVYRYSPYDHEEVSFSIGRTVTIQYFTEGIASLAKKSYRESNTPPDYLRNEVCRVKDNDIEIAPKGDAEVSIKCKQNISMANPNTRWLLFNIFEKMKIKSLKIDGVPAYFHKTEKSSSVYVYLEKAYEQNQTLKLELEYEGRLFAGALGYSTIISSAGWYPLFGTFSKSDYTVTAKYPKSDIFYFSGEEVEKKTIGDQNISVWKAKNIERSSFFLGHYEEINKTNQSNIKINLAYKTDNNTKTVLNDLCDAADFYTVLFGKNNYKTFNVSEAPEWFNEHYSGLIHLTGGPFDMPDSKALQRATAAHEVACQWWMTDCDYAMPRDFWLANGLCEYSSLLYIQHKLKNTERFYKLIATYKEGLKKIYGSRLKDSYEYLSDYPNISIYKSTWIIHMLRSMLADLEKKDESLFVGFLQSFYKNHNNGFYTVKDFTKELNTYTGEDYTWFIDQWSNIDTIPNYQFAYKTVKVGSEYQVKLRIKQTKTTPNFKMILPVTCKVKDKIISEFQIMVSGNTIKEIALPPLKEAPTKIELNNYLSVLCDVDEEDWDDMRLE
jgi:hypothetical protein